jgi:HlyD family secretion protein
MKRFLAIAALIGVAGGLGYGLFAGSAAAPGTASSASQFMTAPIERGAIRQRVTATGTLQALVTVEVGTQLSGQIAELFADFNDEVTKDQPLAQLDTKTFEARLAEARAATAMAKATVEIQRARLQRARVDARDAEAQRHVLQARVDSAAVRFGRRRQGAGARQTLQQRGAATALQLEEARSEREQAAASLREAEAIAAAHEHRVAGAKVDLQRSGRTCQCARQRPAEAGGGAIGRDRP